MDLLLDRNTHDLVIRGYDLALTDDYIDLIRQRIKQRLLLIKDEWFLDTQAGLPWFGELNQKRITEGRVRALLTRQIVNTEGVKELLDLQLDFTPQTRALLVQFRVTADNGASIDVSLTL